MPKASRDSDRAMKINEVASLVALSGWSIEEACQLVCIDPDSVRAAVAKKIKKPHRLPATPPPEAIARQCARIRELVPRPPVGFGRLPPLSVMRYRTNCDETEITAEYT